jgi:hypothetical protein
MAMPWTLAKAKAAAIRADKTGKMLEDLTRLFKACFRIQREACEAAGRHIPLIVENVRGAQPWVGRARWNYGSFYLWGDVPALMPLAIKATKVGGFTWSDYGKPDYVPRGFNRTAEAHIKVPGFRFDGSGRSFQSASVAGTNNGGDWFGSGTDCSEQRRHGSKSSSRKAASAMIAKIPALLARHIARWYFSKDGGKITREEKARLRVAAPLLFE